MGRPRGSRNKKTIERMAREDAAMKEIAEASEKKESCSESNPTIPSDLGATTGTGSLAASEKEVPEEMGKLSGGIGDIASLPSGQSSSSSVATSCHTEGAGDCFELNLDPPSKSKTKTSIDNLPVVKKESSKTRTVRSPKAAPPPLVKRRPLGGVFRR